ncbi:NAD(P)/FAD-dependent oxidoreductase [Alteromonas flava]|uniref:NAD(P)/FAD-dependent oxidoreductase n=1 Tax=Alteromonas flava TaxID=2048003 RepID=UPI000C292AFE|nr:FAD-binding oxidoreductase [Alteromonas flava]
MYDPLVDPLPPSNATRPDSFWADGRDANHYPQLTDSMDVDVAIIGGGYTGLSAALELAQSYGVNACVLEANQPGWGCSGRNGGFVLPGTGRLGVEQLRKRFGDSVSEALYAEYLSSINDIANLIDAGIECDKVCGGYLKLAHSAAAMQPLEQHAEIVTQRYSESIEVLDAQTISDTYLAGTHSHGGIYYPSAFAINPWQFCQGLAQQAVNAGATIYGHSPVSHVTSTGNFHTVTTPAGTMRAKHLIVTSNAYGQRNLVPQLKDKLFPVISSIIVTDPLDQQQLDELGMRDGLMTMDTRPLKYYYRLLPDNRLLFGGRGAVRGKHASADKYKVALMQGLQDTFPNLSNISISHFWSGWVAVSYDDFPRIYHAKDERLLYSAGYCGSGLAFSVQAGKRLAQLLMEPNVLPDFPFWQSPLKTFPFAFARRPALHAYYAWQQFKQVLS